MSHLIWRTIPYKMFRCFTRSLVVIFPIHNKRTLSTTLRHLKIFNIYSRLFLQNNLPFFIVFFIGFDFLLTTIPDTCRAFFITHASLIGRLNPVVASKSTKLLCQITCSAMWGNCFCKVTNSFAHVSHCLSDTLLPFNS